MLKKERKWTRKIFFLRLLNIYINVDDSERMNVVSLLDICWR